MFMQQRLFLSLGTIASYSLETLKADRAEAGYTELRGGRCVLKRKKMVLLTYNLRFPTGDCMVFSPQVHNWSFFTHRPGPKMWVGCMAPKLVHYSGQDRHHNIH